MALLFLGDSRMCFSSIKICCNNQNQTSFIRDRCCRLWLSSNLMEPDYWISFRCFDFWQIVATSLKTIVMRHYLWPIASSQARELRLTWKDWDSQDPGEPVEIRSWIKSTILSFSAGASKKHFWRRHFSTRIRRRRDATKTFSAISRVQATRRVDSSTSGSSQSPTSPPITSKSTMYGD